MNAQRGNLAIYGSPEKKTKAGGNANAGSAPRGLSLLLAIFVDMQTLIDFFSVDAPPVSGWKPCKNCTCSIPRLVSGVHLCPCGRRYMGFAAEASRKRATGSKQGVQIPITSYPALRSSPRELTEQFFVDKRPGPSRVEVRVALAVAQSSGRPTGVETRLNLNRRLYPRNHQRI